jgi:hypothetical protein
MRKLATMAFFLVAGLLRPAEDCQADNLAVFASVQFDIGKPPRPTLLMAEDTASRMFAKAGVRMIWHAAPRDKVPRRTIVIDIDDIDPNSLQASRCLALAYARPFRDAHITVLWDRIEGIPSPALRAALLAHVLVHEITHILEASSRHSRQGIMKAHWTTDDINKMAQKPLTFDREDVNLIHVASLNKQ